MLLASVQKRLSPDEQVQLAAFMWVRHRWMVPYAIAAFLALLLVATVSGFDTWPARVGVGLVGAAIAGAATTDYRVLAKTNRSLVLLRSSRIRQYAVEVTEVLPPSTRLERIGGSMLATEWQVGSRRFTVAKSSEPAMSAMAGS